jgi:small subunit ribosomal protein S4
MARYTGADCKLCRREKTKLFLKGSKCESREVPHRDPSLPPGEHGRGRPKESEYQLQLREKQKTRRIYGVLEKQFRGYYEEANRSAARPARTCSRSWRAASTTWSTAPASPSPRHGPPAGPHGHFLVNGKKVDIPSYRVSEHDIVEVRESRWS